MNQIQDRDILWVENLKLLYSPNSNKMHPIMILCSDKEFYYVAVMTSKKENSRALLFDVVEMEASIQNGMDRDSLIKIDNIYSIQKGKFKNIDLMGQADLQTYTTVLTRALEHLKFKKDEKMIKIISDKLNNIL